MDGFLISTMAATINLNTSLNKVMLVLFLDHDWDWCRVDTGEVIWCYFCWIPMNVNCIIVIWGTLWMFFFLGGGTLNEINFSEN